MPDRCAPPSCPAGLPTKALQTWLGSLCTFLGVPGDPPGRARLWPRPHHGHGARASVPVASGSLQRETTAGAGQGAGGPRWPAVARRGGAVDGGSKGQGGGSC